MWAALRILNVRLRFILLMVVTGLIASQWDNIAAHWERWTRPHAPGATAVAGQYEFYCPMHPSVIRSQPGNCPICGMPLSERLRGEAAVLPAGVLARVQLSPQRIALAGIATSPVEHRALQPMIHAVGTIEPDERHVTRIAARIAGRIEKLFADFAGQEVAAGQPLAEIYSPDLVAAQREYLLAARAYAQAEASGRAQAIADMAGLRDAARERLRLWGIDDAQLTDLTQRGEPALRMTIRAPVAGVITGKDVTAGMYVTEGTNLYTLTDLSNVWMTAYVYETDAARLRAGLPVTVTSDALPGITFTGAVAFVWPTLDESTRTLRVRADIRNPDGQLRPGMYVHATIAETSGDGRAGGTTTYTCPMCPEVVSDHPGTCPKCGMALEQSTAAPAGHVLAVPESAVIDTGRRKVVYLEREPGVFDALAVELGSLSDGYYPVLTGLNAGDRVVTQGAFLVDAENRLNPSVAGAYFGASGSPSSAGSSVPQGHSH